jgi:hypothetical protein
VAATRSGILYVLDPATGTPRAQIEVGTLPPLASPALSTDHAYLPTTTGVTAITVH